jgi:hypothetical protein
MRLADLSGAVVDSSSGMPVSSFTVLVRFEPATASSASGAEGELVPREFIDPRGSFHLDGLLPGSCVVAVRARGFAVWAREVMLAPGEEATVHALLERGSTLRGAVVDRETGLAIPNARVQWSGGGRRPDDQLASRFQLLEAAREWTDAGGQFVLSGLVPGEYSVSACHSGYLPDGDRGRVAIGEAGPEFLELGMRPASGLQGKIGNLEGKWSIALMLVLKRTEGEFGGDRWCHLEQDGRFQFTSLPPGTYRVELGTYQSDPKPEIVRLGEPLGEIVVRAGETATFDAPAP